MYDVPIMYVTFFEILKLQILIYLSQNTYLKLYCSYLKYILDQKSVLI